MLLCFGGGGGERVAEYWYYQLRQQGAFGIVAGSGVWGVVPQMFWSTGALQDTPRSLLSATLPNGPLPPAYQH